MKNLFFTLLLLSTVLVSCNQKEEFAEVTSSSVTNTEEQVLAREVRCPREDVPTPNINDAATLANELTSVINCGRYIAFPDCGENPNDVYTETVTDILVTEWCSISGNCPCTSFPSMFTVADQDALIAQAKTQVAIALRACGLDNASYSFSTRNSWFTIPGTNCEGIKIELLVSATSICCAATE